VMGHLTDNDIVQRIVPFVNCWNGWRANPLAVSVKGVSVRGSKRQCLAAAHLLLEKMNPGSP
jgi:hypothetical protein